MSKTIRIPCSTRGVVPPHVAYVCQHILEEVFDEDFASKDFTACFKRRIPFSSRPHKDAIKVGIPHGFVRDGITFELPGEQMDCRILTYDSDQFVKRAKLVDKSWWVWLEL